MQQAIKNAAKVIAKAVSQYTGNKFALGRAQEISARIHGFKDYASALQWFSRKGAFAAMLDVERTHAQGAQDCEYENEFILRTGSGRAIHAPAYPEECSYVRVVDHAGNEIAYWVSAEWAESPEEVMGALLGALKGGGRTDFPFLNPMMEDLPLKDIEPKKLCDLVDFKQLTSVRINDDLYDVTDVSERWQQVWAAEGDPQRLIDTEVVIWWKANDSAFFFSQTFTAGDLRNIIWDPERETFILKDGNDEDLIEFWADVKLKL